MGMYVIVAIPRYCITPAPNYAFLPSHGDADAVECAEFPLFDDFQARASSLGSQGSAAAEYARHGRMSRHAGP